MKKVRFLIGIWCIPRFCCNFSPPPAKKAKTKRFYIPSHRSKLNFYCKNSNENLLIFSKNQHFLSNSTFFVLVLMKIDQNFYFFRNLWRIFEISLILTHSEWGGCQKWWNNFRENNGFFVLGSTPVIFGSAGGHMDKILSWNL